VENLALENSRQRNYDR